MAAPSYAQIKSFSDVSKKLQNAAKAELLEYLNDDMSEDEVAEIAQMLAAKYRMLGAELGAQWYDYCAKIAGVDVERAYVEQPDSESLGRRSRALAAAVPTVNVQQVLSEWLANEVVASIRETGDANLWRDYRRGTKGGRWARVPVGETCAWCLILASNGAYYVSEETALGSTPDHYHKNCNCIAVYYADAESLGGYASTFARYKNMYYTADNARIANADGKKPYDDELAARVARAKAAHRQAYKNGETDVKWQATNETAIVMRYMYGLDS